MHGAYAFTASMTGGTTLAPSRAARSTAPSAAAAAAALRSAFTARSRSTWVRATPSSIFRVGMGTSLSERKALTPTMIRSPRSTCCWYR